MHCVAHNIFMIYNQTLFDAILSKWFIGSYTSFPYLYGAMDKLTVYPFYCLNSGTTCIYRTLLIVEIYEMRCLFVRHTSRSLLRVTVRCLMRASLHDIKELLLIM